jgi:hypothetical protein
MGAGEEMSISTAHHTLLMKPHRFTTGLSFLTVVCLVVQMAEAQLKLPWEKEGSTKAPPVEATPGAIPEPPLPPPAEEAIGVASPTPVEAVYLAWADQIFAHTNGSVRIGSPQTTAKNVSVSVTLNGKRTTMVFIEKSNDGRSARVIVGPKDSEGDYFGAEKKAAGWVLSSWPEGFRGNGGESEPKPNSAPTITWDDLSSRRLDRRDLLGLSSAELGLLRNEIYARHGQIFNSANLRAHFNQQSWYRPRFKEVDESKFPAILKHNIELIRAAEKE